MKITFVAHEFGIYPGHGGIASYLFQFACVLMKSHSDVEVDVICEVHGGDDALLEQYPARFRVHELNGQGSVRQQLENCRQLLREIRPDVVESADFLGLIKLAVLDKSLGLDFQDTVFLTEHHTASQEIYEWGSDLPAALGPPWVNMNLVNERDQMRLSDANLAPSKFLGKYASNRYELNEEMEIFPYPYNVLLKARGETERKQSLFDLEKHGCRFAIVLITRFEPRKNQRRLVQEFCGFLQQLQARGESIDGIELHMAGNSVPMETRAEDYRQHVYESIDEEYLEQIHFWDFLKLEQQDHLIQMADLAVMPSTFENFPVAMIETVLRDIPVMGSIHSGVADYSCRHQEILTFDPLATGNLADNILSFYDAPDEYRVQILEDQKQELNRLVSDQNTVDRKLDYFRGMMASDRSDRVAVNAGNLISIVPDSVEPSAGQISASTTVGEVFHSVNNSQQTYIHIALLQEATPCDRLAAVLTSELSPRTVDKAIAFGAETAFEDVLELLVAGCNLLVPCVSIQTLLGANPSKPIFEIACDETRRRQVVLDFSGTDHPRALQAQYTDYCFASKNAVIPTLARNAA